MKLNTLPDEDDQVQVEDVMSRDCHGLLSPAGYSRRVQQGTGTGWVYPTLALPVPPAGGWRVGGGAAHSNSARPDVNNQHQVLLINVVSIHHHCPLSFVMTTGKVFFHLFSVLLLLT